MVCYLLSNGGTAISFYQISENYVSIHFQFVKLKPYIGEKPLLRLSAEDLRSLYQTLMESGNRNKGREYGTEATQEMRC